MCIRIKVIPNVFSFLLESLQGRATEMIQGMEQLSYEDKLKVLGLFSQRSEGSGKTWECPVSI